MGVLVVLTLACQPSSGPADEDLDQRAKELSQRFIIVDTHIDVPYRLNRKMEDVSVSTEGGDFDYPRARQGGLSAAFMSIYVPASYQESGGAKDLADELIDMIEGIASEHPDKFAVATSVDDVRRQFADGKMSLPMGMENGAPIEGDLGNLKHFYERGIRYITLTHSENNHICDSSYAEERKWNGLSPFGREVVPEMNRLGIMIDISHVSDETFDQVIELSAAPVVASHSSCRNFTPGWERNMDDEMIKRLAQNGGVIMINFGSSFINEEYRQKSEVLRKEVLGLLEEKGLSFEDEEGYAFAMEFAKQHPIEVATISDVADHFDHVVLLAGVDHVGFGSDFDGVGDSLPEGLKDASGYPNLIAELLRRRYSEEDIEKFCSGNLLRVWSEVERVARELRAQG